MNLRGEYIYELSNQCLEFGLKLWGSFEGDLRHLRGLLGTVNLVHIEWIMLPINVIISKISFNRIEDRWKGVPTLRSVPTLHKVLSLPLAIRNAQLLQGNEPLHSALDVALVSLRTNKAIVGGVLACEIPCGGARYVGSGLSKYEGMRCTSR